MAATFKLGIINGTEYDDSYVLDARGNFAGGTKTLVLQGIVEGLTPSSTSCSTGAAGGTVAANIIRECIQAIEAEGYFIGANYTIDGFQHRLSRRILRPTGGADSMMVFLVFGLTLEEDIYYSVDTQLNYETTSWFPKETTPGTWEAVQIAGTTNIPMDVSRPFPIKAINITRILYGSALESPINQAIERYGDYIGYVNSDASFMGYGRGYWKIERVVSQRRPGGTVQLDATIVTRISRNWMTIAIPQNPVTGRPLLLSSGALTAITKYITNFDGTFRYENNAFAINEGDAYPVALGFYPLTSFYDIFGFSELP